MELYLIFIQDEALQCPQFALRHVTISPLPLLLPPIMSTSDKSTLPSTSRLISQHNFCDTLTRPPIVSAEELKTCETDPTWVPELPPRPRHLTTGFQRDTVEGCVPQGYELEGNCGRSSPFMNTLERNRSRNIPQRSSPHCHLWAKNVKFLLDDVEGVSLFTRFLEDNCDTLELEKLDFCFACAGLKKTEPETIRGLVRLIYKKYFKDKNLGFPSEMRERLSNQIKERSSYDKSIFEEANEFMLHMISETSYTAFLNSPLCLNYAYSLPNHDRENGSNSCSSSISIKDDVDLGNMTSVLSTVHEDMELVTRTPVKLPLTRDALLKTQGRRLETAPKMLPSPYHTKTIHPHYISCNPVSSQDSDARTESDLSITDGSMDGTSSLSRILSRSNQKSRNDRILNKDNAMHDAFVPITQKTNIPAPPTTDVLIKEVIAKLEEHQKKLESDEQLKRKLVEEPPMERRVESSDGLRPDDLRAELVKVINKDALQLVEESSQDILDKHCKRVFSSDQTPTETPNFKSPPRNKSPELPARRSRSAFNPTPTSMSMTSSIAPPPVPAHGISSYPYSTSRSSRKKDKDGISIVSVDSGNIHDFPEGSEHYHYSSSLSSHHLPKSKSMPDYAHSVDQSKSDSAFLSSGHRGSSKWWSSKKAGDLTDSGVSVVSDSPPVIPFKDKNRLRTAASSSSGNKPTAQRSGSLEQCLPPKRFSHSVPAQSFAAEMPLEPPHLLSQLDEVGRRLMESDRCRTFRPRHSVSSKGSELPLSSYPSTLRRSMTSQPNMLPSNDKLSTLSYTPASNTPASTDDNTYTVVVFSFSNDEVPYRTKVPGSSITLKQFKDCLPKKGSFRYFFKTKCDDLDIKVIQEEIFDDSEVLPLWEGKVMAQVKSVE